MAHNTLLYSLFDISSHCWFSSLADETRDFTNQKQLVVCSRCVVDDYEVLENFASLT